MKKGQRKALAYLHEEQVTEYFDNIAHNKNFFEQKKSKEIPEIVSIIGNGDVDKGYQFLFMLAGYLREARRKHPVYALGCLDAFDVINDEVVELKEAILHEGHERSISEAMDVIVTALRFVNTEWIADD